jgi:phage terminase large subunit-like protein
MSSAALSFEAEVLEGLVDANGCPLMAWCASNTVVQRDGKDNIYPVKKKSKGRIDPIMAAIIARRLVARSRGRRTVRRHSGSDR